MTPLRVFVGGFLFTSILSGCTVIVVHPMPPAAADAAQVRRANPCDLVDCHRPDTRHIV